MALDLGRIDTVTIDHRMPVSRGGTDDLENLVASCHGCNQSKRAMSEAEFRAYLVTGIVAVIDHPPPPTEALRDLLRESAPWEIEQ